MMTISKHAIERFKEGITWEENHSVEKFIKLDISKSKLLYRKDDMERRTINGIIYVIDCKNANQPIVVTLFLDC